MTISRYRGVAPHIRMAKLAGCSLEHYIARSSRGEKFCGKCATWKPLSAFTKDPDSKSGYSSPCRECNGRRDRSARATRVVRNFVAVHAPELAAQNLTIPAPTTALIKRNNRAAAAKAANAKRRAAKFSISLEMYNAHVAAGLHCCLSCRKWKPRDDFGIKCAGTLWPHCKLCRQAVNKKHNDAMAAKKKKAAPTPIVPTPPKPDEYVLPATDDAILAYHAAKADPARKARFAAKQQDIVDALRRADQAQEEMLNAMIKPGRRYNRKPIAVGSALHGGKE